MRTAGLKGPRYIAIVGRPFQGRRCAIYSQAHFFR